MSRELNLAERIIKFEEGLRLKPYYCTERYPTIGYGERLGDMGDPLPNITWTEQQSQDALMQKLNVSLVEMSKNKETKAAFQALEEDDDRKAILISMWYQLGIEKLSGFKNTLKAIANKDWELAKKEMLNSKAARQTPKRWKRQAEAMLSGNVFATYKL
mgnify:CR=1 FL=1